MGLSMGTMLTGVGHGGVFGLYYVDSDGTRLEGNLFCVGSGQTFAYGVLDRNYRWDLTDEEALALATRSILAATHRYDSEHNSLLDPPAFSTTSLLNIFLQRRILWWLHQPISHSERWLGASWL